ncbi:MAG: AmmeMemoRadiSam system protein B [Bacteroidales bacterium]|nr:AmmeMemoRadiSam system protein B [Candidatus Latescibacterota bacterium]
MKARLRSIVVSAIVPVIVASASGVAGGEGGDHIRIPVDSIGYALDPSQVEAVVSASIENPDNLSGPGAGFPDSPMIGGICPHDDYVFAGAAYVKLMKNVKAPLAILIGVSHRARRIGIQGRLVFETFSAWKGPYGDVPVSGIREDIIAALPPEMVMINDSLHAGEHSLEGLIPFLQYPWDNVDGNDIDDPGKIEILPVLVTRLAGEKFQATAEAFAGVLHRELDRRGLRPGFDYTVIISADCVHYGDEGWGGRNYSPYGTGREGYEKAVAEDMDIISTVLMGQLDGEKIKGFRDRVDSYEFEWPYKIPWCGVYSIPFGLEILSRLCELEGRRPPSGIMLDYGTSLEPGIHDIDAGGLGATNIATLRHWVGFTSIGYW